MARFVQFLGLALAVLAGGCCLPQLGGRYADLPSTAAQPLTKVAAAKEAAHAANSEQGHGGHGPRGRLGHLHPWHWSRASGPGTPSGEIVPVPRFHPVPVRPVFEPQFDYSLPQSLALPLAPIVTPPQTAQPEAEPVPTPAKPVPDPA